MPAMLAMVISPMLFTLSSLAPSPAEAARRDGAAYTRADAAYVTTSKDPARLDLIVCLQGVAGHAFPGGDIKKALEDGAFACGAWANRIQDIPGEPDGLDLFDMIQECGFQPGDASPDAGCDNGRSEIAPSQPGLQRSAGGDGPVTRFTLVQDLAATITVSWIGFDGAEHVADGGKAVRQGGQWRVENGAKGYESHWYSIRSGNAVLFSFALRQNAVVKLSQLSACRLPAAAPAPVAQTAYTADVVGLSSNEVLTVRSAPTPEADKVGVLPGNARGVRVQGCDTFGTGQWCEISHEGVSGFVAEVNFLQKAGVQQVSDSAETWWVVVGTESNPDNGDTGPANARVNDKLAPCRMEAFSDWSGKWKGFTPGYSVSVLGGYASKQEAEAIQAAVSACIPDAYVKRGTYLGE